MPINFDNLNTKFTDTMDNLENLLQTKFSNLDPLTATAGDYAEIQMQTHKWTLISNLQSNTVKTISEGMKSTIGNIR